jgi:Base plate wedge protein 53
MSKYFAPFPLLKYSFGSAEAPVLFQNISAYIDLVDQIKDDVSYYQTMQIEEYERPDTLSYKLYGTTDFYWTFYLLNDDIREGGWPLSGADLQAKALIDYPNRVITTTNDISSTFLPGETLIGVTSGSTGKILKRYLNLGQIVVSSPDNYGVGELVRTSTDEITTATVYRETAQYNSVHHYENSDGEWVDINPYTQNVSGLIPVTYLDRMIARNEELKTIKVLKKEVAPQISANFKKALLS